jgi:hypothetical protein
VGTQTQIVKAMALIRRPRDGALLVSEQSDPAEAPFHRPLGGHVDFGEYALKSSCLRDRRAAHIGRG